MVEALKSGWLVAIAVAVLPALLGVISNLITKEARTPRDVRNLGQLAESLSKIPKNTEAHESVGNLVAEYANRAKERLVDPPKLNKINVSLTVFIIVTTLTAMYFLVNWITGTLNSGWNVLAVIVTVVCGLFLFLVNIASVTTWYKPGSDEAAKQ